MVNKPLKIIWSNDSKNALKLIYDFIKKDSLKNAIIVRNKIVAATKELKLYPYRYPADKLRLENDGNFRAFVIFHYRISYQISEDEIFIIRIRHTSMEPLDY